MRGPVQRRMPFHALQIFLGIACVLVSLWIASLLLEWVNLMRHHKHSAGGQVHRLPRNRLMATVVPRFVLLWALLLATSPDGARGARCPRCRPTADRRAARGLAEGRGRVLARVTRQTNECDVASPNGPTALSLPTARDTDATCTRARGCDRDCAPSPSPPPRNPWPHSGTWPSAPPPAPPPNVAPVVFWTFLGALDLHLLLRVHHHLLRPGSEILVRSHVARLLVLLLSSVLQVGSRVRGRAQPVRIPKDQNPPAGQRPSGIPGIPMQEEVPLDTAPSFDKRQFSGSI